MTQGFCVLGFFDFPASDRSGLLSLFVFAAASSSSVGSRSTSARRVESGDQTKSYTSCGVSVSFCASPPSRLSSQTWVLPSSRADRNASHLLSGLQRGWDELTPSAVNAMASPPVAAIIQVRDADFDDRGHRRRRHRVD